MIVNVIYDEGQGARGLRKSKSDVRVLTKKSFKIVNTFAKLTSKPHSNWGSYKRLPALSPTSMIDLMLLKGHLFPACYFPDMGGNGAGSDIKKK